MALQHLVNTGTDTKQVLRALRCLIRLKLTAAEKVADHRFVKLRCLVLLPIEELPYTYKIQKGYIGITKHLIGVCHNVYGAKFYR